MNRGGYDPLEGSWLGVCAVKYTTTTWPPGRKKPVEITSQWIDTTAPSVRDFQLSLTDPHPDPLDDFWLAAPKTTDLLLISPQRSPEGLALDHVGGHRSIDGLTGDELLRAMRSTALRAAAVSSAFILIGRAAMELDVDPEEFDIIDPRAVQRDGSRLPVLQFADRIVNGAGLSSTLGQVREGASIPMIAELAASIVDDHPRYPLDTFGTDQHRGECERACYQCLLRHSNQGHHGLLDWRLGLAFTRTLVDPQYDAGLTSHTSTPELPDWSDLVERSLERLQARLPGTEIKTHGDLHSVPPT